ncbi:MAG: ATP-binding protein [Acidobacteriota bacterium]
MEHPSPQLFHEVCREIGSLVPCDRISLALPSRSGERFVVITALGDSAEMPTWEVDREGSCAGEVLSRKRPQFFPNLGAEFRYAEEEILYKQGMRDAAFLPLFLGAERFGVLILSAKEPESLDARGVRQLERSSGLLALAFAATRWERADILTAAEVAHKGEPPTGLQRAYRNLVAFSRVANRILQEGDLGSACRLFVSEISEHSGYRRAILALLDEQGREFQWFFAGYSDEEIDDFHSQKKNPADRSALFQERFKTGHSYLIPASAGVSLRGIRPIVRGAGEADLLLIPLYGAGGALVGIVMLDDPTDPVAPTVESLSPLELFANQVGHAIEKKRLDQVIQSAEARLRQAQEHLMQAEKMSAIGQLISGVAHELNNPLAGVIGYAQLLRDVELNPKARKNLDRICSEAERCQKIVQNLLGFSRRHKPEKARRNLNDAIEGVLQLRAYQLQVDDVEVLRRYDPDLPDTMFDFHRIQQAVLNVVNNAHQAMTETSGRPRRLTIVTKRAGDMVQARFIDTGPGISRDRLSRIFDSFYTTKEAGRGTGLGLSLSRTILREHRGSISATSVLGEGTTFLIEIPLVEEACPAAKPPSPKTGGGGQRRPMRVLVVDDERILVELLTDFLRSVGHTVDQARDGRRALQLVATNRYDVILSDLKMPGLDGQGLYQKVRAVKPDMARRFIFSTGDLANPKVQTFFQSTGSLYLTKPFRLEEILSVLDQLSVRLRAA